MISSTLICLARCMRSPAAALLGLLVLVALSTPAQAGEIGGCYKENLLRFAGKALHGEIGQNDKHDLAAAPLKFGGVFWRVTGSVTETAKTANDNDKLRIEGDVQHLKAPHPPEAAPNPNKMFFKIDEEAGKGALAKVGLNEFSTRISVHHDGHFDDLLLSGVALVGANKKDILAYSFVLMGGHHGEAVKKAGGWALEPNGELPANVFGSAGLLVDPSSGRFALSLVVSNISLDEVLQAHIRLGSPDTPGPIVFPLDPGGFEAVNGGVVRWIDDGQFPLGNLTELLTHNTFLEIVTPSGNLSGQCGLPHVVGGIVEMPVDASDAAARAAEGSGPSSPPYAAIAGAAAAAALALTAGAWYARRRWLR